MKAKIMSILVMAQMIISTVSVTGISIQEKNVLKGSVIDQEQPNHDVIVYLDPDSTHWQHFWNKGNILEEVELYVGCVEPCSDAITLSIEETLGTPLTSVTYLSTDLPNNMGWFKFDIPDEKLKFQETYYIVLRIEGHPPHSSYHWAGSFGNPYPNGWSSQPDNDFDFAFRTIVDRSKPREINTPFRNLLQNFLQSHPNMFPLLQKLIQHFGLYI